MYGELASVKGIVDLSSQEALDSAEAFLERQGYVTAGRTDTTLTVERRQPGQEGGESTTNLTVKATPQVDGGVQIVVRGSDQAGVQAQQAAWTEWSESLPKKLESQTTQPGAQPDPQTHEVPLLPPPTVESADVPPAPQGSPGSSFGA